MDHFKNRPLTAVFLTAFILFGVPHWLTPYNKATAAGTVLCGVLVAAVAGAARYRLAGQKFSAVVSAAALGAPAAALARVIVETVLVDPTSHNLWPFELAAYGLLGFAGAVPGALLGALARRLAAGGGEKS